MNGCSSSNARAAAASTAANADLAPDPSEAGLAQAILCRVRFRRGLCGALLNMCRPSQKALEVARKMLKLAEEQIEPMAQSAALGTPRSELTYCLEGRAVRRAPRGST